MATAKQKAWRKIFGERFGGKKKRSKRSRGASMAKKGKSRRKGGFSSGGLMGGDIISAALEGIGAASLTRKFVGAPLGQFTGAGAGAAWGVLKHKNVVGAAAGGWLYDNIVSTGGAATSSGGVP